MDKQKLVQEADLEMQDMQEMQEEHRIVSVPSSMCYSVFTTLCCCTPLGLAALMMSLLSHDSLARGKYAAAASRARLSRRMSHFAVIFGLLLIVILSLYLYTVMKVLPEVLLNIQRQEEAAQAVALANMQQQQQQMP